MTEKNNKKIFTFTVNVGKITKFLEIVSSRGYIADSSSKSELINDCILRFDGKVVWTIVEDVKRNFICSAHMKIENVTNPDELPIEIGEMIKWLGTFDSDSTVKVLYENGVVGIKCVRSRKTSVDIDTDVVFLTKRLDKIQHDMLTNLDFGTEKDQSYKDNIINNNNKIFKAHNDDVKLFYGVDCNTHFSTPTKVIKKILDDGGRIGNRIYPFQFNQNSIKITVKILNSKKEHINRTIRPNDYSYESIPDDKLEFSARLTHAVHNSFGTLDCYVGNQGPLFIKTELEDDNIKISYIITTF